MEYYSLLVCVGDDIEGKLRSSNVVENVVVVELLSFLNKFGG